MAANKLPEVWLRGQLTGILPVLQPVAHALLQAKEEVNELMHDFPEALIWKKPSGVASVAFHLEHIAGVIERLFQYAKGEYLSEIQLNKLHLEGHERNGITLSLLLNNFNEKVQWAITEMQNIEEKTLFEFRGVGRSQLPSTVIGLLFHSAEHTMRHVGQLLVTVRVLKSSAVNDPEFQN